MATERQIEIIAWVISMSVALTGLFMVTLSEEFKIVGGIMLFIGGLWLGTLEKPLKLMILGK